MKSEVKIVKGEMRSAYCFKQQLETKSLVFLCVKMEKMETPIARGHKQGSLPLYNRKF